MSREEKLATPSNLGLQAGQERGPDDAITRLGAVRGTVVFSHGKESGPWGSKITAMAAVVRGLGLDALSVDYRGLDDPADRVRKLIETAAPAPAPLVLVGSSMGGHVSAAAASRLRPRGLFLLAPAFYMAGYEEYTPQVIACPTAIVHGWHDVIVPVENGIRWAREHQAALHVLDSDHRLEDQIDAIGRLLRDFLLALGLAPDGPAAPAT